MNLFFDALESLTSRDRASAGKMVRQALADEEMMEEILRAFLIRAAHQDPRAGSGINAVVLVQSLWNYAATPGGPAGEREFLFANALEFLVELSTIALDSKILEPGESSVVAVQELEMALLEGDRMAAYEILGKLLNVMDNRSYLSEILLGIALRKSARTMVTLQAAVDGLDRMGWNNHFRPFLILHAVNCLLDDSTPSHVTPIQPEPGLLGRTAAAVKRLTPLVHLAALVSMRSHIRRRSRPLDGWIAGHMLHLAEDGLGVGIEVSRESQWINLLIFKSAVLTLSGQPELAGLTYESVES